VICFSCGVLLGEFVYLLDDSAVGCSQHPSDDSVSNRLLRSVCTIRSRCPYLFQHSVNYLDATGKDGLVRTRLGRMSLLQSA
jgi:hypothetical protein